MHIVHCANMMLQCQDTGELESVHHCKGTRQKKEDWLEMGKIAERQTDESNDNPKDPVIGQLPKVTNFPKNDFH